MADQSLNETGYWLSLTALAKAKGVSKPAISQNLRDWAARGVQIATRKVGRELHINVAEYDRARGEVGHTVRAQDSAASPLPTLAQPNDPLGSDPVFSREQAREKAYAADLKKLDLGERTRKLVPVDRVEEESEKVIAVVVKALDRLPSHTDAIVGAHNESGGPGVRAYLKGLVATMRNDLARACAELAASLAAEPRRDIEDFDPNPSAPVAPDSPSPAAAPAG